MKKIFLIATFMLLTIFMLASCEHEHKWSEWKKIKDATCTAENVEERSCRCGEIEKRSTIKAKGHTYGDWTIVKAATCDQSGEKVHYCSACNNKQSEVIPQKTHLWKNGVCTYCSMNCIEEIGKIIMDDPDSVTSLNEYIKGFAPFELSPNVFSVDNAIGFMYSPNSKQLTIRYLYISGGFQLAQTIMINGAVAKSYKYQYEYDTSGLGGGLEILYGSFNPQTLKNTKSFTYEKVKSPSYRPNVDFFSENACGLTKTIVEMLNGFCKKYYLPFSANELGFTGYTN